MVKTIGRKLLQLRRAGISKMLRFTGLTTSLFIFQACYGTPNDLPRNLLEGQVKSSESDSLIRGIQVMLIDPGSRDTHTVTTNEYGAFTFPGYGNFDSPLIINAQDIDGNENGRFLETQLVLDPKQHYVYVSMAPAGEATEQARP